MIKKGDRRESKKTPTSPSKGNQSRQFGRIRKNRRKEEGYLSSGVLGPKTREKAVRLEESAKIVTVTVAACRTSWRERGVHMRRKDLTRGVGKKGSS